MKQPAIEQNISIPTRCYADRFSWVDFMKKLQVGDSFKINRIDGPRAASYKLNITIVIRKIGKELYRVWRTK